MIATSKKTAAELSVLIVLVLVLYTIHNPCKILGITCINSRVELRTPHLLLCTHDYEHVDLFCMAREARQWYARTGIKMVFVVADKLHNRAFCSTIHRKGCIVVKSHTTEKVIRMLETRHVCMFVYRQTSGKGAYYMSRGHPVMAVRIRTNRACSTLESGHCVASSVMQTIGCTARIQYRKFNPSVSDPEEYMQFLKAELYGGFEKNECRQGDEALKRPSQAFASSHESAQHSGPRGEQPPPPLYV